MKELNKIILWSLTFILLLQKECKLYLLSRSPNLPIITLSIKSIYKNVEHMSTLISIKGTETDIIILAGCSLPEKNVYIPIFNNYKSYYSKWYIKQ